MADRMDFGNGTWFDRVQNKGAVGGRETYDYNQYLQWGGKSLDTPTSSYQGTSVGSQAFNPQGYMDAHKKQQEELLARQKAEQEAFNLRQKQEQEGKLAQQRQEEQDYLAKFAGQIAGQETMSAMAGRIGTELGLPDLQSAAQGLVKTLKNIPQVQQGATRGFDVNENQLARIVSSEQGKIAPLAQEATTQAQNAQNLLTTRLGYGLQDQSKALQPILKEGEMLASRFGRETSSLADRLAREFTGYTQGKQNELTALLDQGDKGMQLTINEMNRLNQLAAEEREYKRQQEQYATELADKRAAEERGAQRDTENARIAQQYALDKIAAQSQANINEKNVGGGSGWGSIWHLPGISTPSPVGTWSAKPATKIPVTNHGASGAWR